MLAWLSITPLGRAAGVEDRRQRIGIARGRRQGARQITRLIQRARFLHRLASRVAGFERLQPRGRADQQARAAVAEDMRHLRALEQRVHRHVHQPGARGGERHQARQLALRRPGGYPRARLGHTHLQPTGQPGDTRS
jgi:hypothetical protein